jgi:integrase
MYPAGTIALPFDSLILEGVGRCGGNRTLPVAPAGEKRAVSPGRRPNADCRKREHPTESEVEKLVEAAKGNRYGHRDATTILVDRHGLRASELCELTWDAFDFRAATIHVNRKKNGQSTTHQISGTELRALRKLQKEQDPKSAFVFVSERGTPFERGSRTSGPARLTSAVQKMIRINPHRRPFLAALSVSSRAIAPGFSFRVCRTSRPSSR